MSTLKIIAVALVTVIAAGATTTAWAAPKEFRGSKTYLPGEGGCKDDSGQGWVTYGCGD